MLKNTNVGLLVLRCAVGGLMLLHGIAKLKGIEAIEQMLDAKGLPSFLGYGVYVGEILAPLAIIVGFRTRLAAVVLALTCVTAIYLAHSHEVFALSKYGGWAIELLGLYLFGSVALFFTGGGKMAISHKNMWD